MADTLTARDTHTRRHAQLADTQWPRSCRVARFGQLTVTLNGSAVGPLHGIGFGFGFGHFWRVCLALFFQLNYKTHAQARFPACIAA